MYKVITWIDHLDPDPSTVFFDTFDEAQDFVEETVDCNVRGLTNLESREDDPNIWDDTWELEMSLVKIEETHV